MRILFVTQWFQPEPVPVGMPFARELTRLGHKVEVLTGFPNYPQGKLYPGYRVRPLQREMMDGVSVVRVPLYPSHDKSAGRRIVNYTSFALSAALIGPWAVKPADVAYVYHPPGTVGLPAWVLHAFCGMPVVLNIQDLWPDTLVTTGMFDSSCGLRLLGSWCKFVYRTADRIVVISPGFKRRLCERGVPAEKIEVIYNWCDDSVIHPVARDENLLRELGLADRFNIVFAGNMGLGQALDAVLDAAQLVAASCPRVQFVFVGGGVEAERLKQKAEDAGLANVRFLPRQPYSEIVRTLALADVLLVHLRDDPLFRITIPSKTQAYMSVGRPILIGVRGDAADLVAKAKAGLACEPENPESIARAVQKFQAMPPAELAAIGENGKRFYAEELSLAIGAKRYEAVFKSVARQPRGQVEP